MCGLFGFAGKAAPKTKVLLAKTLCVLNSSRGVDSTGCAAIAGSEPRGCGNHLRIYRRVLPPVEMVRTPKFCAHAQIADLFMGHTRFATAGKVLLRNQHPFHVGRTVLAHNGVVSNVSSLKLLVDTTREVDSHYLADMIDAIGHVGPAAGSLNLTYWQGHKPDYLRLCCQGKSLCIAECAGFAAYSSEMQHLLHALAIVGLTPGKIHALSDNDAANLWVDGSVELTNAHEYSTYSLP